MTLRAAIAIWCTVGHVLLAYRYPISCFSCASEEYEKLYQSSKTARTIGVPVRFDKNCNHHDDIKAFSPAVRCDSACVTVLEPQYFGGILNEKQPYTFIRGCATDVFAWAASRPAEVDFMHNGDICLSLPISEIWPDVMANDLVTVCSCTTNGCNVHDTISAAPQLLFPTIYHIITLCLVLIRV